MLYTKCILKPPSSEDGFRFSVMSRHTLNDGKTPNPLITDKLFIAHLHFLGPPPKVIGAYIRGEIPWIEFEKKYQRHIRKKPIALFLILIAIIALFCNITILCIECTHEKCHRRLIAEECQRFFPKLQIEHR